MPYVTIDPSRYDAESPITESLIADIIGNIDAVESLADGTWTPLTGTGTYTVPSGVTKLRVLVVSGGAGGCGVGSTTKYGGGGAGGGVREAVLTVSATVSYSCGAGGAGSGQSSSGAGGTTTFGTLSVNGPAGITWVLNAHQSGGTVALDCFSGGNVGRGSLDSSSHHSALVGGTHGTTNEGGGGGPMCMPYSMDGIETYLGNGGNGGSVSALPTNGSLYGAGGGGSGYDGTVQTGGNGSAGIIFVSPIG